ncbi:acetylornithine transaminase [Archaeoglobus veneficus]|uniref:Acetylornithine aminotransferase n=1 Tax=Archaeoglobus veneficus (strain DSM 11195 / SNP6) TaxID=693661 RepID=F2KS37_ARCVS|nr:acetylornithine transaminase [Archaeoglobus veneficus]AEA47976.1 Acetylornithine/succinyldiaminopimelate aminotransferase [Archaeoglobus veneficus SNP6]
MKEWFERERAVHIQFYRRQPVVFVKGEGCYLYDVEGKKYLDMVAGIAAATLGHCHPKFIARVSEQLKKLVHVSNLYYTTPQIELAEKLREITGMDRFFFCNSGAEAVEASLKIARKATGRKKFVAFSGSFHGRTMGALSVTWKEKFRRPFEPLVQPVEFAEFNSVEDLEKKVDEETAAVILEPVQGEAGVYPATKEFINELFRLRDEYNFLVIFDEVQTGFGRTGRWFAKEHYGVKPDIMAMAKAMGSGFPIGGVGVSEEVAEKLEAGEHASTFGGNPLACVASLATIEIIEEEKLVENSEKTGKYLRKRLEELDGIKEVRGMGLMIGAKVENAPGMVSRSLEKGLLVNATSENALRFVPPLIAGREEIDFAVDILSSLK